MNEKKTTDKMNNLVRNVVIAEITNEYHRMVMAGEIPSVDGIPDGCSALDCAVERWAADFAYIHQNTDWQINNFDFEVKRFAKYKLCQFISDISKTVNKQRGNWGNLVDNALEIIHEYYEMTEEEQILPIGKHPNIDNFFELKEAVSDWAFQFENEHQDTDWSEQDYLEEIRVFARRKLFSFLRDDKVFYTEEWSTEDIFNAAEELEVSLSSEELDKIIQITINAFADKSDRSETIYRIVEQIAGK